MANAATTAQRKIDAIDKRIDAVRAEILRTEAIDEMSAGSWQRAWDNNRALRAIEASLYLRRADASDIRADIVAKEARAAERRAAREYLEQIKSKWSVCTACGHEQYAA